MIRYFLFFLLFCSNMIAQKKLSFDRMIEYEVVGAFDWKKQIFLTSSTDQSYYCSVFFKDDGNCWLYLYFDNGYIASAVVKISSFFEAETIIFPKQQSKQQFEPMRYDLKRYDFALMSDTLLEAKPHAMYGMKYKSKKEVKLYDRGQALFIVEPGTESYTPLPIFSSYFDVHISSKIFPKGIATEMLYYNANNSKLKQKMRLITHGEIKPTYIVVPN